jgi:hypothetical protein
MIWVNILGMYLPSRLPKNGNAKKGNLIHVFGIDLNNPNKTGLQN